MNNKKGVKLLAAIMAFAMVLVAGFAIIGVSEESDAETVDSVTDSSTLVTKAAVAGNTVNVTGTITLTADLVIGSGTTINIASNYKIVTAGHDVIGSSNSSINGLGDHVIEITGDSSKVSGVTITAANDAVSVATGTTGNHEISNCIFDDDDSSNDAIYVNFGGCTSVVVKDCTFNGTYTEGAIAGQLYNQNTTLTVSNCTGTSLLVYACQTSNDELTVGTNLIVENTSISKLELKKYTGNKDITLVVPAGEELSVSQLKGDEYSKVNVAEGGYFSASDTSGFTSANITNPNPRMAIGSSIIALEGDLIIVGDAYILENLTIPEGKNVIIRNGGTLDLNSKALTIVGSLIVENGGIVKDNGTGSIVLTRNGTLDNSGVIGYGSNAVTVTAAVGTTGTYIGTGSVSMKNASGVEFGLASTTYLSSSKPVYMLTVTGDITATDTGSAVVTVNGARIVGEMTIGQEVTLMTNSVSASNVVDSNSNPVSSYEVNVMSKAVLTIDGTLGTTNNSLIMQNGSTVIINGKAVGTIKAYTGEYTSGNSLGTGNSTTVDLYGTGTGYVTGVTFEVKQYNYTASNGNLQIQQRLEISGTTDLVSKTDTTQTTLSGSISITNTSAAITTIPEGSKLILDEGISFNGDITSVKTTAVYGQIQYPYKASGPTVTGFLGSKYIIVDATDSTKKAVYIEPFASAIKQIDVADNKTVTVSGALTISEGFVLAEKQRLVLSSNNDAIIGSDAVVELQKGSSVTNKFATAKGVLIINTGASCNAPLAYEVMKKTTDYIQYSGLAVALKTAVAGDEITIAANANQIDLDKKALTVPSGITLITNRAITTEKEIVVEKDAKLIIKGSVTVTSEVKDVTVNGTLDASEGTLNVSGTGAKLISKGETILTASNFTSITAAKVQGFVYTNESNNNVVTTLANAVAKASAQDINNTTVTAYGTVTETDAITLDKVNLSLNSTAKVTLGEVTLKGKGITTNSGELTATIIGLNGDGDAAANGVVKLSKYGNTISQSSTIDTKGVTVQSLTLPGISGEVEIVSGTVKLGNGSDYTFANNSKLTVDKDATLVAKSSSAVTLNDATVTIIIDGTLQVLKDLTISDNKDQVLINGTLEIIGTTLTVDSNGKISVIGDVVIKKSASGTEGCLAIQNSKVTVGKALKTTGSTGTITGKVQFNHASNSDTHFIVAYAGSDLSGAIINPVDEKSTAKTTTYFVNGVEYATVYAKSSTTVTVNDAINAQTGLSIDGYTVPSGNTWKDADGEAATSKKIGEIDSVSTQLTPGNANIIYSAGTGISLWVDNVKVNSSTVAVPIQLGTHTVFAKADPGFKGDVTITFNGQKVTDGKIVITADMTKTGAANVVLSASGDITVDPGEQPAPVEKDDGMGITDYLLIVLVILAAILVVVVAIRMMRS